jgi:F-type H+-transporting ATPase subunit delta
MEEIARVYARALFEVANEQQKLDVLREQLGAFADAVEESRELKVFLFSPYFTSLEKKDGLRRAVIDADDALRNFLELLIDKHRMPAIFRIRRAYDELWEQANRLLPVSITAAVALDEEIVTRIGDQIGAQTDRRVQVTAHVDPEIIGGLVLRVGNSILDASIRTRLDNLKKNVAKAA